MVKIAYRNILESSAITITAGAVDADTYLDYLYDRRANTLLTALDSGQWQITIDQGAVTNYDVSQLLIPSGHNLAGVTLALEHSADGINWTDTALPVGAAGVISHTFAAVNARYWRFTALDPLTPISLGELWLCDPYTFERDPSQAGSGPFTDQFNAELVRTTGGIVCGVTYGARQRQRPYTLPNIGATQRAAILAAFTAWGGVNPIWLYDHFGEWMLCHFRSPIDDREVAYQRYSARVDLLETLA